MLCARPSAWAFFIDSEIFFRTSFGRCLPDQCNFTNPSEICFLCVSAYLATLGSSSFVRPLFHACPFGCGCSLCLCSVNNLRVSNTNPQWEHFQVPWGECFGLKLHLWFFTFLALNAHLQDLKQNLPPLYEPSCSFPQFSHFIFFFTFLLLKSWSWLHRSFSIYNYTEFLKGIPLGGDHLTSGNGWCERNRTSSCFRHGFYATSVSHRSLDYIIIPFMGASSIVSTHLPSWGFSSGLPCSTEESLGFPELGMFSTMVAHWSVHLNSPLPYHSAHASINRQGWGILVLCSRSGDFPHVSGGVHTSASSIQSLKFR